ncbi:MAG: hypothetical protein ACHQE5_05650 [Actinomycetes bacterium]
MADRAGRYRGTVLAALLVLAGPVLAACTGGSGPGGSPSATRTGANGVQDLTAQQILDRSKAAAKSASWVHVTGTQDGTTLDLTIGKDTATGSVTEGGLTAQLLAVGGTTYIKGDKAFWDNASGVGSGDVLAGKWVVAGSTKGMDTSGLDQFTDVGRMVDTVLAPTGTLSKSGVSTVDGQSVVGVRDSGGQTLYVALTGPPYPVQIQPKDPTTDPPTFSDWNVPATIVAPGPSDVVDPTKLGG